jgi:L-ribulose-5-phosphate 3-epimerase
MLRRKFITDSMAAGALLPLMHAKAFAIGQSSAAEQLEVHIFSKHLQFLNYRELAEAAAQMGFAGVDLTVRPKGHVEPGRVEEDLPKVVAEFKKAGLSPKLMTTAVSDAADPVDKKLLQTAARLGFKYYRMNWFPYKDGESMPASLQYYAGKVKELGLLNKEIGLTGVYQNHAGTQIGSSFWEVWQLVKDADKDAIGSQFDIRHAMVEGSSSWPNALKLLSTRIRAITLKDYKWREKNGAFVVQDVPIGEGMVDFDAYFKLVKQYNIRVPVSLHIEYDLGGAQSGDTKISIDKKDVFSAMKKDLNKIQELWARA